MGEIEVMLDLQLDQIWHRVCALIVLWSALVTPAFGSSDWTFIDCKAKYQLHRDHHWSVSDVYVDWALKIHKLAPQAVFLWDRQRREWGPNFCATSGLSCDISPGQYRLFR